MTRRFRWAELQIIELEKCYNEHEIRQALKEIPESLEKTYYKVLDSIVLKDVPRARGILTMICLSPVALDVKTVAEMFDLEHSEDIIKICTTSLVREFDDKIQVAHFSVQEFLTVSEGTQHHKCQFSVTDGHRCLAEMTVDQLLAQTEVLTHSNAMKRPSFLYAAKNWDTHLAAAGCIDSFCSSLQRSVDRLFTEPVIYINWVNAINIGKLGGTVGWQTESGPPVKLASAMGLIHTVDYLITNGSDPFQRDRSFPYFNSLSAAARNGHLDVLQFLLNKFLPLTKSIAESMWVTGMTTSILQGIDHRKAGKAKLGIILQTLRDHGLLTKPSTDLSDKLRRSMLSGAMANECSRVEIMSVFLDWRPEISVSITDDMLISALRDASTSSPPLLKLLLEKYYAHVPPAIIKRLDSYDADYFITKCLLHLAIERPNQLPITDDILGRFASRLDSAMVLQLLRSRSEEIRVTQHVLENAAANSRGADMLPLMWPYGEPGMEVSKEMLVRAKSRDNVGFLLQKLGPTWTLDEPAILEIIQISKDGAATLKVFLGLPALHLSVSEGLIESICCNKDAVEMLKLVAKDGSLGVPITENAVHAAVLNRTDAASVINYLAQLSQDPLPVTERVIIGAVDPRCGDTVLKVLMRNTTDHMFTDRVFEKACYNKAAMMLLLDQTKKEPPLEKILRQISRIHAVEVLQVLVERHLVNVDQHLFETFATSYDAVEFLLSLKQDVQITEGTLIATMWGGEYRQVLAIILKEQGLIPFTEKVTRAAFTICPDPDLIKWLFEVQPEPFVRDLFERAWRDDLHVNTRIGILLAFIDKTGSGITDTMLQDYPYDPDSPKDCNLDEFIWVLWGGDDLPDLPATERGTEIILERCDIDVIEIFLREKGGLVTESVVQAADRNRIVDKKEVMRLLRAMPRWRGETMALEVMEALDKIVE